eukprot:jgi/Botrbrau1/2727/Bobra.0164s0007.1
MNNWRRFVERVDFWVIRYSSEAILHYWGLNNLTPAEALGVFRQTKGVWLVGGEEEHADKVAFRFPEAVARGLFLLQTDPISALYHRQFDTPRTASPSTGYIGISAVLHCTTPNITLHLYGMNWSNKTWSGHKVDKEQAFVAGLEASGRVVVHPTPCIAMRECGPESLDQSCHWASDGRYMCLRGNPKKWTDQTHLLASGRKEDFFSNATTAAPSSSSTSASQTQSR